MKYITISLTNLFPFQFYKQFNLCVTSIQLQNKMKTNFRIICLKNEENRNYREEKMKVNNIIIGQIERSNKKSFEKGIPNLVYLSARLQDDKNDQKRPQSQNYHSSINRFNQLNSISNRNLQELQHEKAQESKRLRQLQIQKFFQEKQYAIRNQKNTMKNLLGSINFSPSKHRQKKISKLLKEACKSERSSYKQKGPQRSVLTQNKPQLQSDFHNFLANKHQQSLYHPTEETEDMKLKRLSRVNPEKEIVGGNEIKAMNLFHFLDKKDKIQSGKDKNYARRTSSSNSKIQSFFGNSRIEKIFNFQSNLKTQQQQFEWSKLKDSTPNHKKFFLRTLDL